MHGRFKAYILGSLVLTCAAIQYAYETREQFYPTVVFLSTNKLCILILSNMALCLTLLLGRGIKKLFLGQLREYEVELLGEHGRYAVTETALALTVFRQELSGQIVALLGALLFAKAFHWLAQARVDHLDQVGAAGGPLGGGGGGRLLLHARLVALLLALLAADCAAVMGVWATWRGPSALLLFGFEFAILATAALATFVRYLIHAADSRIEGVWHGKPSYIFLLEFSTEVVRFGFYLVFFALVFTYYGVPLHLVRDLWGCYSKLRKRLEAYRKYRALTANMNERFPDATPEQLEECENTCIICRDHMDAGKSLPCGHIFHFQCLRMWLQHQQSCPTCRADIPAAMPAGGGGAAAAAARAAAAAAAAAAAGGEGEGAAAAGAGAAAAGGGGGEGLRPGEAAAAGGAGEGPPRGGGAGAGAAPPPPPPPPLRQQGADHPPETRRYEVQPAPLGQTSIPGLSTIYGNPVINSEQVGGGGGGPAAAAAAAWATGPGDYMLYRALRPVAMFPDGGAGGWAPGAAGAAAAAAGREEEVPAAVAAGAVHWPEGTLLCSWESAPGGWVRAVAADGTSGWVRLAAEPRAAGAAAAGAAAAAAMAEPNLTPLLGPGGLPAAALPPPGSGLPPVPLAPPAAAAAAAAAPLVPAPAPVPAPSLAPAALPSEPPAAARGLPTGGGERVSGPAMTQATSPLREGAEETKGEVRGSSPTPAEEIAEAAPPALVLGALAPSGGGGEVAPLPSAPGGGTVAAVQEEGANDDVFDVSALLKAMERLHGQTAELKAILPARALHTSSSEERIQAVWDELHKVTSEASSFIQESQNSQDQVDTALLKSHIIRIRKLEEDIRLMVRTHHHL